MFSTNPRPSRTNAFVDLLMKTPTSRGNASAPPPINWATRPQPTSAPLQDHVEESDIPIRRLVPVFVDPDNLTDFQEALRLVSQPAHQQCIPDSQGNVIDDASNLQALLRHLGHQNRQRSRPEVQADACLDGRDVTSDLAFDSQDLTSAFSRLSTSVNSSPVRPLGMKTVPRVSRRDITDLTSNSQDLTSTFSRLSTSANSSPVRPLAVKTVPRVSGCSNLSTSANTMASTSDAPSLPLGVRTVPDNARTLSQMQSSPRKKKYYVVIVGKCARIYYEHW